MRSNLGKEGRDKVTGFQGIITSKHIYLTGCTQYGLQPPVDKDGKFTEQNFFDEGRIEIIGEGIAAEEVAGDDPGCDRRERP